MLKISQTLFAGVKKAFISSYLIYCVPELEDLFWDLSMP